MANKVSGNLAGIWLLVAEHLRLGTWDLLCGWTGQPGERVEPRLALQLVHREIWERCQEPFIRASPPSLTSFGLPMPAKLA